MKTTRRGWAFVALGLFAIALSPVRAQDATLEELAGRLLGYGFDEPELIVGKLPQQLPLEVPLFEGTRIVGTSVRSGDAVEVVLDVRSSAEAIQAFYKEKLTGFEDRGSTLTARGGFEFGNVSERPYVVESLYCRNDVSFRVSVYRLDAAIKDVRLAIDRYQCQFNPVSSLKLPSLTPPSGAEPRGINRGFGGDISSSIRMMTTLTLAEIHAHYTTQLQAAGWQALENMTLKVGAIGSFEFKDASAKVWRLILLVVPAEKGAVSASLRVFEV